MELTTETYGDSVAVLSQIIVLTENNTNEQTNEVLSTTANYFEELADFVNESSVIINTTVRVNGIEILSLHQDNCQKFLSNQLTNW